jgi:large subunit ribosomal protein L35
VRFGVQKEDQVPKCKTHKGSAKRFQFSGSGKAMHPKGYSNHKKSARSKRSKRQVGEMFVAFKGDAKRMQKLLPYGDTRR